MYLDSTYVINSFADKNMALFNNFFDLYFSAEAANRYKSKNTLARNKKFVTEAYTYFLNVLKDNILISHARKGICFLDKKNLKSSIYFNDLKFDHCKHYKELLDEPSMDVSKIF